MRDVTSYPSCFDPYLRYAISTGFRNFQFFDERHHKDRERNEDSEKQDQREQRRDPSRNPDPFHLVGKGIEHIGDRHAEDERQQDPAQAPQKHDQRRGRGDPEQRLAGDGRVAPGHYFACAASTGGARLSS